MRFNFGIAIEEVVEGVAGFWTVRLLEEEDERTRAVVDMAAGRSVLLPAGSFVHLNQVVDRMLLRCWWLVVSYWRIRLSRSSAHDAPVESKYGCHAGTRT